MTTAGYEIPSAEGIEFSHIAGVSVRAQDPARVEQIFAAVASTGLGAPLPLQAVAAARNSGREI